METDAFTNIYDILGIPRNADDKTIDRKLGPLLHKYHPDRNPDDAKAVERFAQYSDWRDLLKDTEKRKELDSKLRRQEAAQRGQLNKLLPQERFVAHGGRWAPAAMGNPENTMGLQRNRAFRVRRGENKPYDLRIETHRPPAVERSNALRRGEKKQRILEIADDEFESEVAQRGRVQYSFMVGDDRAYMEQGQPGTYLNSIDE